MNVDAELPGPPGSWTDNPAREVLDWLYRFVTAIELSPAVAVHSQDRDGITRFWNNSCPGLFRLPAAEAFG